MVYTVYVDKAFLLDFILDYLLLYSVAKVGGIMFSRIRLSAAALLGALYTVATLVLDLSSLALTLVVACLMVICAFGFARWKMTFVLLGAGALLGGATVALNYINGDEIKVSLKVLFAATFFSFALMSLVFRKTATGFTKRRYIPLCIETENGKASIYALVDSGNTLCDPLTHTPVIVAHLPALKGIFTREEYEILENMECEEVIEHLPGKFTLMPYKTISGSGFLPTFRPCRVTLGGKGVKALVAVTKIKISDGAGYDAITGLEEEFAK